MAHSNRKSQSEKRKAEKKNRKLSNLYKVLGPKDSNKIRHRKNKTFNPGPTKGPTKISRASGHGHWTPPDVRQEQCPRNSRKLRRRGNQCGLQPMRKR